MRILVTGAAGFIGSHLCDGFLTAGHTVVGVDNLQTGRRENLPIDSERFLFREADVASASWWPPPCPGLAPDERGYLADFEPDVIVHCAASYDDREKWHRDTNTNVNGAINVAIAAKACGARVVYFQTALIYGNNPYLGHAIVDADGPFPLGLGTAIAPQNSYAISKYAAEQYLKHSGVPLLTLRLANIYGPRNLSGPVPTFYKRLAAGENCTIVDSRRDFVYITDLVDLVEQAVGKEATGTYHVSTGTDYPIGQLYDAVLDAMGKYGTDDPIFQPRGDDDAPTILLDPSATQRDFGWQATTEIDEGVAAAVEYYREHPPTETFTHLAVKG